MNSDADASEKLETTIGDLPLDEYRLQLDDRTIKILHATAVLSHSDESRFLLETPDPLPYGLALWSATVALAHDLAARAEEISGRSVLELGAGTGLPGIVAAALGAAKVVQTDRNNLALTLCKRNCERNEIERIEHRLADWTNWSESECYDLILGSDILYGIELHTHLRRIFETNLAPGGRILLSDPFRSGSFRLLEKLETDGWSMKISKWTIGEQSESRSIAIFELAANEQISKQNKRLKA